MAEDPPSRVRGRLRDGRNYLQNPQLAEAVTNARIAVFWEGDNAYYRVSAGPQLHAEATRSATPFKGNKATPRLV